MICIFYMGHLNSYGFYTYPQPTSNRPHRRTALAVLRLSVVSIPVQVNFFFPWLSRLALRLPLVILVPLALGTLGEGHSGNGLVYQWLEGENAEGRTIAYETTWARG